MKHTLTIPAILSLLAVISSSGCLKKSALFCDEDTPCTDPALPFCDLNGDFPASDGIGNTCIPQPSMDGGVADAGGGDGAVVDWSAPTALGISDSRHASIAADGLELTFDRVAQIDGSTVTHPFTAFRSSMTEPFTVVGIAQEFGPFGVRQSLLSPDKLELFATRSINGNPDEIQRSVRATPLDTWGPLQSLGIVGGRSPSLSGDALALYFMSGQNQLNRATRASVGAAFAASAPVVLPAIDGTTIFAASISNDELQVVLTTQQADGDVYIARRANPDVAFGTPVLVPQLTDGIQFARFGVDDTEIYLSMDPDGLLGEPPFLAVSRLE